MHYSRGLSTADFDKPWPSPWIANALFLHNFYYSYLLPKRTLTLAMILTLSSLTSPLITHSPRPRPSPWFEFIVGVILFQDSNTSLYNDLPRINSALATSRDLQPIPFYLSIRHATNQHHHTSSMCKISLILFYCTLMYTSRQTMNMQPETDYNLL